MPKKFKFDPDKNTDPDSTTMTNGRRADNAEFGVEAACHSRGETGRIDEDSIRDLLADLGHLCDREGLDFVKIVATATKDWRAER